VGGARVVMAGAGGQGARSAEILDLAARIADDVLFPAAMAVDAADRVPAGHLDLLAAQGLYGLAGPPECGGLGTDPPTANRVIEDALGLVHHGRGPAALRALVPAPAGRRLPGHGLRLAAASRGGADGGCGRRSGREMAGAAVPR